VITVFKFGVHYKWQIPEVLREQLWLGHQLREDLVTLQLEYEAGLKEIWSSYPAVAAAEEALSTAEAEALEATEEVSRQRQAQRTKRITGPAADVLTAARKRAKEARVARREAIAVVKDEAAERINALAAGLRASQKAKYAEYAQEKGLYWATFNDVLDHHKTAVKLVAGKRAAGRPATLRHHRFDGTGSVAVQLQRQAGQPQRTPALIADPVASRWRNVLGLPWVDPEQWEQLTRAEQRARGRVTVRMRCGTELIEVPVQIHRMLPADADITGARLVVAREGSDYRISLAVTAKIGDPEPVTSGPSVALHFGWRGSDAGPVVARWQSDAPVDIPEDFMVGDQWGGKIVMPAAIVDRLESAAAIQAGRDEQLNTVRAAVVEWLAANGPVPHPVRDGEEISAADASRWRSPARFAALAGWWRAAPPVGGGQIAEVLEAWRASDKRLWNTQVHTAGKALRRRDDLYRQVAAILADQAGLVVVDDTDMGAVAASKSDAPTAVTDPAARRRTYAAPGVLRASIVAAAAREGVPVRSVSHKGMSVIHAECGTVNECDDRFLSALVECEGCGKVYDQDANALEVVMREAHRYTSVA
jgi:hypothetical protein